ncbi:hypothetical protein DRE_05209 [Drechslerella stenobrocha 248]|uniref:SCP domain-containing protein n=1 Tax=Drechslerella stenobrocha 248 TaxID=1043628 RepID=W7I0B8_9PEZI|nr:hypothetical protein DRE_05209 [Drechslerella stenobrocha 248]
MKAVKGLILIASLLSACLPAGLAAATTPVSRDVVLLAAPVERVGGQQVWHEGNLVTDESFDASNPTKTLLTRQPAIVLGRQADSPTPTAYTSRQGKFSQDMLRITNELRAIHGSPPVVWNKTLATYASRWGRRCNFQHSRGPYGENLAGGGPMNNPVWYQWYLYSEVNNYDYNNPGFSSATGHFTQLVWKATEQMGCAWIGGCSNLAYQVWCEFTPAGNMAPVINYVNNVGRASRPLPPAPPTYDPHYD